MELKKIGTKHAKVRNLKKNVQKKTISKYDIVTRVSKYSDHPCEGEYFQGTRHTVKKYKKKKLRIILTKFDNHTLSPMCPNYRDRHGTREYEKSRQVATNKGVSILHIENI